METEPNSSGKSNHEKAIKSRGKALLARISATFTKAENALPRRPDNAAKMPKKLNPESVREQKQYHLAERSFNMLRAVAILPLFFIVALIAANLYLWNPPVLYVTSPPFIEVSAAKELEAKMDHIARADDLRLFVRSILPALKGFHHTNLYQLGGLRGFVHPSLLQREQEYRRSVEQSVQTLQIVQTLDLNMDSVENYVFNEETERISFNISGRYRISGYRDDSDMVRDMDYRARLIFEVVPLSGANPFGFFLVDEQPL